MTTAITQGDRVAFDDSEHGPQRGIVLGILPHIGNGERYAVIEVDHALPGCLWNVPLSNVQREALAA